MLGVWVIFCFWYLVCSGLLIGACFDFGEKLDGQIGDNYTEAGTEGVD